MRGGRKGLAGITMASPFDHVLDSKSWPIFENLGWDIHLPFGLTKYMVLEVIAAGLLLAIFIPLARRVRAGEPPRGRFWNAMESLLTFVREYVAKPCIGEHDADRFVPFLWTLFLFILFCNLLGMVPFFGSPTANITVTLALAVVTFLGIHGTAIARMGFFPYLKSYAPHMDVPFGMGYVLAPGIALLEIVGQFIKGFVLAVRLFANMFAGHTVLAFILFFIVMVRNESWYIFWPITAGSVLGVAALSLLELFVAFLQAFIFVFLASLFLGMALHPSH
jgi:F-type H+-transporting ATPase subunit a